MILFLAMFVCGRSSVVRTVTFEVKDYFLLFHNVFCFSAIVVFVGSNIFKDGQKEKEKIDVSLRHGLRSK